MLAFSSFPGVGSCGVS